MSGITSSSISTAAKLYRTPALLKASLHASANVELTMSVQSSAFWKLLKSVMAMNMPTTIMAMLIMELKSTKLLSYWNGTND